MLKPHVNDGLPRISFGVEQPPALGVVTDAEGRYRITDVSPGAYRVSVFAPAHAVEGERDPSTPGKTINLVEGDNVEGIDFALIAGRPSAAWSPSMAQTIRPCARSSLR